MSKWLEKQRLREEEEAQFEANIANIGNVFEDPEVEPETPAEPEVLPPAKPGSTYEWVEGDQLSLVAKRFGLSRNELLDHNGIEDPAGIKPGDKLHLPFARPVPKDDREVRIEVLNEPVPMHVAKAGGCKQWAFADMKTWDDANPSGFYPQNTNVMIVAVAHVPITEKDGTEIDAAYYLDGLALGDYAETGRAAWMIGFMWSDLETGHVDRTVPLPPVIEQAIAERKLKEIKAIPVETSASLDGHDASGFDNAFIEKRIKDGMRDRNMMKFVETYQLLDPPVACVANLPMDGVVDDTGHRFIWIHDFAGKRPDRKLTNDWEGYIAGTFEYDGILYGRPAQAAKNYNWYGIPMGVLQSHDELYNLKSDAATRAATGNLTWSERNVWQPLSKFAYEPRFRNWRQRKNKNK